MPPMSWMPFMPPVPAGTLQRQGPPVKEPDALRYSANRARRGAPRGPKLEVGGAPGAPTTTRVTEERPGWPGGRRARGAWGAPGAPIIAAEYRGAPRVPRGATSAGGLGGARSPNHRRGVSRSAPGAPGRDERGGLGGRPEPP